MMAHFFWIGSNMLLALFAVYLKYDSQRMYNKRVDGVYTRFSKAWIKFYEERCPTTAAAVRLLPPSTTADDHRRPPHSMLHDAWPHACPCPCAKAPRTPHARPTPHAHARRTTLRLCMTPCATPPVCHPSSPPPPPPGA
jgi:hypothetical protein